MEILFDILFWISVIFSALILVAAFIGAILFMFWNIKFGDDYNGKL